MYRKDILSQAKPSQAKGELCPFLLPVLGSRLSFISRYLHRTVCSCGDSGFFARISSSSLLMHMHTNGEGENVLPDRSA